jgi:uncharacterized protein with PIN domain
VKLLLDEMLDVAIAEQLRKRGHDVEAVQGNAELEGRKHPELLRAAFGRDRILVTDNVQDFARLHQQFMRSGEAHSGILLVSPRRHPRAKGTNRKWADGLDRFLKAHETDSLDSQVCWLP